MMETHEEKLENVDQELNQAIEQTEKIPGLFEDYYPVDIAEAMEALDEPTFAQSLDVMSDEQVAAILEVSEEDMQRDMLAVLDDRRVLSIFGYMSQDDIVDILGDLSVARRKTILNIMKRSDSEELTHLLNYGEKTAGGLMTTEFISLNQKISTAAALYKIKDIGPTTEVIETIFITDVFQRLIGVVDLRDIFTSDSETPLGDIMNENVISVPPEMDQEEVALLANKYDLNVIPVVNPRNIILGIITYDDIIDVLVAETSEDILRMGGVSAEETVDSSINESIRRRLPWLLVNLVTAFAAAAMVGLFSATIAEVVALAATMPIISGMGGNAGSQVVSIMIRSITLGEVNLKDDWKYIFKEITIGLLQGLIIGAIAGFFLGWLYDNYYLALIVIISMMLNMIISGIAGFSIPLMLKQLKLDPALASSIFVTALTDSLGFFIFLGLATLFLPYLI